MYEIWLRGKDNGSTLVFRTSNPTLVYSHAATVAYVADPARFEKVVIRDLDQGGIVIDERGLTS